MAAAMNLQKFPGMRGTEYAADFTDASGLRPGNRVQIAGVDVGRVDAVEFADDRVTARFSVKTDVRLGSETSATVEVLNTLGEKYLRIRPRGSGELEEGGTIPLDRTAASYDIVTVLTRLSDTSEELDIPQLKTALRTVAETMDRSSEESRVAFDGLSRLSRVIATRDAELKQLLGRADRVSGLLADRRGDLVQLMADGGLLFEEIDRRRAAIHRLLVNARVLARELGGLVDDNQEQVGPMLDELSTVTTFLVDHERQLRVSVERLGPFVSILGNIVGTGPWFDAILVNLLGIFSGEFVPRAD